MPAPTSLRRLLATAALLLPAAVWAAPAEAAPPPTVAVTPNVDLVDFQAVHLTGSGFEPDALMEWFQCRGGAVSEADCDGYNADFIDADGSGNVSETVYVDARIFLPDGTEVDCRTDPAGCEIGVGFMVDADEWPEVALDFDAEAPLRPVVTGSVTPDRDLVDGQVVRIDGQNLSFREETFAYLCTVGEGDIGERCDLDGMARGVPDAAGVATGELTMNAPFDPPLGDPVDCRRPGTDCVVHITWGFAPPPDRVAIVPVGFEELAAPPTTSSTTSTPTTAPGAPPVAPTPPPAAPLPGQAGYTG